MLKGWLYLKRRLESSVNHSPKSPPAAGCLGCSIADGGRYGCPSGRYGCQGGWYGRRCGSYRVLRLRMLQLHTQ
eukprot:415719-Prorocentrum_minimum.AAC.1